jgi:hypothetical protein
VENSSFFRSLLEPVPSARGARLTADLRDANYQAVEKDFHSLLPSL